MSRLQPFCVYYNGRTIDSMEARTLLAYSFARFAGPRQAPAKTTMLFDGGFSHQTNRHGVLWFIDHVLPLVRALFQEYAAAGLYKLITSRQLERLEAVA